MQAVVDRDDLAGCFDEAGREEEIRLSLVGGRDRRPHERAVGCSDERPRLTAGLIRVHMIGRNISRPSIHVTTPRSFFRKSALPITPASSACHHSRFRKSKVA